MREKKKPQRKVTCDSPKETRLKEEKKNVPLLGKSTHAIYLWGESAPHKFDLFTHLPLDLVYFCFCSVLFSNRCNYYENETTATSNLFDSTALKHLVGSVLRWDDAHE